jgi:hypothetical protein
MCESSVGWDAEALVDCLEVDNSVKWVAGTNVAPPRSEWEGDISKSLFFSIVSLGLKDPLCVTTLSIIDPAIMNTRAKSKKKVVLALEVSIRFPFIVLVRT